MLVRLQNVEARQSSLRRSGGGNDTWNNTLMSQDERMIAYSNGTWVWRQLILKVDQLIAGLIGRFYIALPIRFTAL